MLIGYPPFYSEDSAVTCQKILAWKKVLRIPQEPPLSAEAVDLILKLLRDPNDRLGSRGVEDIKRHPFFKDINWEDLEMKVTKPPRLGGKWVQVDDFTEKLVSNVNHYVVDDEDYMVEDSFDKVADFNFSRSSASYIG